MPNRRPVAAALAALSLAATGGAVAQDHRGEIDAMNWNWHAAGAPPAAARDLAGAASQDHRNENDTIVFTKFRLSESVPYVGRDESNTIHGAGSESVDAAGSKDMQLKSQKVLQNAGQGEKYFEIKMEEAIIASYQTGGDAPPPRGHDKWLSLQSAQTSRPRGPGFAAAQPAAGGSAGRDNWIQVQSGLWPRAQGAAVTAAPGRPAPAGSSAAGTPVLRMETLPARIAR